MIFQSNGAANGKDMRPNVVLGKVASPPRREATSDTFHFWVGRDRLVEKTQIVRTDSTIAGRHVVYHALVDEVYRQSRKADLGEEFDACDGDIDYEPPFRPEGFTFASATILRADPSVLTPPLEGSEVRLGDDEDARRAFGADEIERPLAIGLVKNGGDYLAGPGCIDLDYLLGQNGGHLNVNGAAGRGTKSSYLLFVLHQLLREARRRKEQEPSGLNPLIVVPIVFNVKGYDLFHIHRPNRRFDREKHLSDWELLGVLEPEPFRTVAYYAPQMKDSAISVPTGGDEDKVSPYSWSLRDVIEQGLLSFLFAEEDRDDPNFGALIADIEEQLTQGSRGAGNGVNRKLRDAMLPANTFQGLLDWTRTQTFPGHHQGTRGKFFRRLLKLVVEGDGILRRNDQEGNPLNLVRGETSDPLVVDLNGLAGKSALQRFVVATVLRQLVEARAGTNAISGVVYLVVLDELNRFAPKGARDPITKLIETVTAEMRSQGIILLGAQQQASKVSETVIENASIRVVGRSGALELSQPVWGFLSKGARSRAIALPPWEKLVIQDDFRDAMHVRVPFPAWAMRREEAISDPAASRTHGARVDADEPI